jgi:hypothetical protein
MTMHATISNEDADSDISDGLSEYEDARNNDNESSTNLAHMQSYPSLTYVLSSLNIEYAVLICVTIIPITTKLQIR